MASGNEHQADLFFGTTDVHLACGEECVCLQSGVMSGTGRVTIQSEECEMAFPVALGFSAPSGAELEG